MAPSLSRYIRYGSLPRHLEFYKKYRQVLKTGKMDEVRDIIGGIATLNLKRHFLFSKIRFGKKIDVDVLEIAYRQYVFSRLFGSGSLGRAVITGSTDCRNHYNFLSIPREYVLFLKQNAISINSILSRLGYCYFCWRSALKGVLEVNKIFFYGLACFVLRHCCADKPNVYFSHLSGSNFSYRDGHIN